MDTGPGRTVQDEELEGDTHNKDRWAQALVNKMTAVTVAFRGAGDQRHAARRTYLQMAPEARTESYLEVIDEVLYQSTALSRLTRNARMAVARRAHVVEFLPGEALCVRGTPQDALLVVMSGEVEVVEGHWDSSAGPQPPPEPAGRFGGLAHDPPGVNTTSYPPFPQQQQQQQQQQPQQYPVPPPQQSLPASQHSSRRHLSEQLSMSSAASLASGAAASPQPPATPLPLQLDSRHTIHPALQSHPSAHRRYLHNQLRHHSRASVRRGAARSSAGGGDSGDGGSASAGSRAGSRVVLHRGDSLGAVDMGWLSRLPRSSAAAALEDLPASPSITSRALLATRAEIASGGSLSREAPIGWAGSGGFASGVSGAVTGSMMRSLGPVPVGGDRRRSSTTGGGILPFGEVEIGSGGLLEGGMERDEGSNGVGNHGGGRSGNSSKNDPLQRLRWACTAVAAGGRVECAAIGLQQLCAVLATEMHWDVEAMVESLEELPVFAALSGADLRQLVRVLRLHTFSGGTMVYKQGSVGNDLYIIRSGCVRLRKQVALDDNARNRLNRISAELSVVRDQTAAAAASLLHGQQAGGCVAPFGSSAGYSPAAGPACTLSNRSSAAASLSGSVSNPPSPSRTRRLSQSQGGQGSGGLSGSQSGGWYGPAGRFSNGPPGSPRSEGLSISLSSSMAVQNLMGRGSAPSPPSAPPLLPPRDRTPLRPARAGSGGRGSSAHGVSGTSVQKLPSPPSFRPDSDSGPTLPGTSWRLPDCNARTASGGYKDQSHTAPPGPAGGALRRHSASTPMTPSSPVGQPPQPPQSPAYQRNSTQYGHGAGVGGGGSGGGGSRSGSGSSTQRQHCSRRRTSHATGDDLLDRLGSVPRALGERAEALYEDVVMPGQMGTHPSSAGAAQENGEVQYGSSDSEGGSGASPSSPVGLPPVTGSRPPSMTQLQGGWAVAAAAAVGSGNNGDGGAAAAVSAAGAAAAAGLPQGLAPGAATSPAVLPAWQTRVPRQLGMGQELVLVELGVLTAGQCFGEVRSDGVAMRTSSAVCDTRTEVLAISRNELHQRMGGRVFDYLWNQVPNDGSQNNLDPAAEAGQCAQQLERSMQWTLFKQKLVADVLTQKEQRRRTALKCR